MTHGGDFVIFAFSNVDVAHTIYVQYFILEFALLISNNQQPSVL